MTAGSHGGGGACGLTLSPTPGGARRQVMEGGAAPTSGGRWCTAKRRLGYLGSACVMGSVCSVSGHGSYQFLRPSVWAARSRPRRYSSCCAPAGLRRPHKPGDAHAKRGGRGRAPARTARGTLPAGVVPRASHPGGTHIRRPPRTAASVTVASLAPCGGRAHRGAPPRPRCAQAGGSARMRAQGSARGQTAEGGEVCSRPWPPGAPPRPSGASHGRGGGMTTLQPAAALYPYSTVRSDPFFATSSVSSIEK